MKHRRSFCFPLVLAFAATLVSGGCEKVRYPRSYILNFPPPAPHALPPPGALGPLAIRPFHCPDYLCEGRIVYRPSPEEVGHYEYHRWAMNPRDEITQFVANTLRASGLFRGVVIRERGIAATYVMRGNIDQLEEVDYGGGVRAVCRISAQLLDAKTGSVLWSDTASEAVPVGERTVVGVVRSLSTAAQVTVQRLVDSLERQFGSRVRFPQVP